MIIDWKKKKIIKFWKKKKAQDWGLGKLRVQRVKANQKYPALSNCISLALFAKG